MDFLVTVATDFIGIFQKGGEVLASLVTGIVPTLLVLMTAVYAFTALVGEERIDRVIAVSARDGIQYTPLRYIVAPVLAVFFLTNPMAYTQGRWFPEKYKPAFYDAAVSYVHPPLGLFPHINPGEIFVWLGIATVGVVMAAGTLLILDASLPGGLIEGSGDLRHAQTMAFTTLVMFQLFNVFNARSDETSVFAGLFTNRWLWAAVAVSLVLHIAVVYVPFLQQAFSTRPLSVRDWLMCLVVASSVLWIRELNKAVVRVYFPRERCNRS